MMIFSWSAKWQEIDGPDGWPILVLYAENNTSEPTTSNPTNSPTLNPTNQPTYYPTSKPTKYPTKHPTHTPTIKPTKHPTTAKPTKYPTLTPTKSPTNNPTIKPTKHPITAKPTKVPTQNEDDILNDFIVKAQRAKRAANVIKLYVPESYYLMNELETFIIRMDDADAVILRNIKILSQCDSLKTYSGKDISVQLGPYFNIIDDVFQRMLSFLRMMVSFNAFLDKELFNELIEDAVHEISRIDPIVFDKIYSFLERNKYNGTNIDHLQILGYIRYLNQMKRDNINVAIKSKIQFEPKKSVLELVLDFVLYGFLEILDLKTSEIMDILNESEFLRSSIFPHQLASIWMDFVNMTRYTLHETIPELSGQIKLLETHISDDSVNTYQQTLTYILHFGELLSVLKSNINIGDILYHWKFIKKKEFGTIYVALLAHEVEGRRIVLDVLLNALGYDNQHIERYDAKYIEKKSGVREEIKRGVHGRRRKKSMVTSLFNIIPYKPSMESLQSNMDILIKRFVAGNITQHLLYNLDGFNNTTNVDMGILKIYIVEPSHPSNVYDFEKQLLLIRDTNTMLLKNMKVLSSKEVLENDHRKKKMAVISYCDNIDNAFEHLVGFLQLLKDKKLGTKSFNEFIGTTVFNLKKLDKLIWNKIYSNLYENYYNQTNEHRQIIDYIHKLSDLDTLIIQTKVPSFLYGPIAYHMMFDMILLSIHEVMDLKMNRFLETITQSKYSKSTQFPKDTIQRYGKLYMTELITAKLKLRSSFDGNNSTQKHERLDKFITECIRFQLFKMNIDIGNTLYQITLTPGPTKKGGSVSVAILEWQLIDPLMNILNILEPLGYDKSNIYLYTADLVVSKGTQKTSFQITNRKWNNTEAVQFVTPSPRLTQQIQTKSQQKKKKRKK